MNLITFKRPRLAVAGVAILIFVVVVCLVGEPNSVIDKYGWLAGSGFGTFFVITGGKAIRNRFGNLAVLLFVCGVGMWLVAILATDPLIFASNVLHDSTPTQIGAVGGMFSTVEDEHDT